MALIFSIDTAMENAAVCIANGDTVLASRTNSKQTDHAAWIHNAIRDVLEEARVRLPEIKAVAVTSGPGSYTGLRVGMATAKGLCYALGVPLITVSTLHLIATGVMQTETSAWICPMIDARRMEVFTVMYDAQLHEMQPASALVLDEQSFGKILAEHRVVFAGNGAAKWEKVCRHPNALFAPDVHTIADLAAISIKKYNAGDFTDLAYSEPSYLKNVYFNN